MTKSLAELGSQADQHKRNLHILRGKERVAEDTLTSLRAEIEGELTALQSVQERATAAFEAIRDPSAPNHETPASAEADAIAGLQSVFAHPNGAVEGQDVRF